MIANFGHLAAGGGKGQDNAQGQACRCLPFVVIEIPDVALVGHAVADGLGGVNGASAADGQQEIHAFLFAQLNAFIHQAQPGIRHRAAEGHVGDGGRVQGVRDFFQQSGTDDASSAVVNQDLFAAELPDQGGNLCFRAFAEDHLGGRVVIESKHCFPSRLCMMKLNRNLTETMIKLRVNFKSRAFLTASKDRPETVVSDRDIHG